MATTLVLPQRTPKHASTQHFISKTGEVYAVFHRSAGGAWRWEHKPGADCTVCTHKGRLR